MDRTALEAELAELPILQYEFISTGELTFSERIRRVCETECPMYGKTWACPPGAHEEVTRQAERLLRAQGLETYVLSTEACTRCKKCTYPDAPCRFPQEMYPCTESHTIVVTDIAEKYGIEFITGNAVTWFSILFFREP